MPLKSIIIKENNDANMKMAKEIMLKIEIKRMNFFRSLTDLDLKFLLTDFDGYIVT